MVCTCAHSPMEDAWKMHGRCLEEASEIVQRYLKEAMEAMLQPLHSRRNICYAHACLCVGAGSVVMHVVIPCVKLRCCRVQWGGRQVRYRLSRGVRSVTRSRSRAPLTSFVSPERRYLRVC